MTVKAYLGRIINPLAPGRVEDIRQGGLVVDDSGEIVDYGELKRIRRIRKAKRVDYRDHIIIPGLIDLHTHLSQYEVPAVDRQDFTSWLKEVVYPAEEKLKSPKVAKRTARRFFNEMKAKGTTTACIHATIDANATDMAFQEADRAGVRVVMGKVMADMDMPPDAMEDTSQSLKSSEDLCRRWNQAKPGKLLYSFIPRAAPCCTMALMERAAQLAKKHGAYVQTHLAENLEDLRDFKKAYPAHRSYTDVYFKAGLLGPKTIAAHAIYLDDHEIRILKETATAIAHCPSSNLFLRSGIMDLNMFVENDVRVGLGTDLAGGPDLSILKEMGEACIASKALSIWRAANKHWLSQLKSSLWSRLIGWKLFLKVDAALKLDAASATLDSTMAFYLATLGGARALSLDDFIGSFAPGKQADFLVLKIQRVADVEAEAPERILSLLAYRPEDCVVESCFVQGKQVYSV